MNRQNANDNSVYGRQDRLSSFERSHFLFFFFQISFSFFSTFNLETFNFENQYWCFVMKWKNVFQLYEIFALKITNKFEHLELSQSLKATTGMTNKYYFNVSGKSVQSTFGMTFEIKCTNS